MDMNEIAERIRLTARNTDSLIVKLDTLTNRINTARDNENAELVEYYEGQFAEASVEFMDGVETILDNWYALNGVERPSADQEIIESDLLDEIHKTVVNIVQSAPVSPNTAAVTTQPAVEKEALPPAVMIAEGISERKPAAARLSRKGPDNKVDITG